MRTHILTLAATALLTAVAIPAAAAEPGDSASATTAEASLAATSQKEEKKVCKMLEKSGSHMAKRVCLTKDEWKKIENEDF